MELLNANHPTALLGTQLGALKLAHAAVRPSIGTNNRRPSGLPKSHGVGAAWMAVHQTMTMKAR